jgi:UDP-glucuronate 4-epimerase
LTILVTGAAGFIGSHVARHLLARGDAVVGIDNLNDYYSVQLKKDRLKSLSSQFGDGFAFHCVDFADPAALQKALKSHRIDRVVHLGAQAGVRYSLVNPEAYVRSNIAGHLNLLEFCRHSQTCDHMVYGSSSSVYGANEKLPFAVVRTVGAARHGGLDLHRSHSGW